MSRKKRTKIAIGIPHASNTFIHKEFHLAFSNLLTYTYEKKLTKELQLLDVTSPNCSKNRNKIFELAPDCEYILQIDDDMTFPPNLIELMLEDAKAHQNAVITGCAHVGNEPHHPALYIKKDNEIHPIKNIPKDRLFVIDYIGSFCFLTPRALIEKLPDHPFDHYRREDGTEVEHDFAFSERVLESGGKLIADPRIRLGHIRTHRIGEIDWNLHLASLEKTEEVRL